MSVRGSLFACAAALFCGLFQIAGIAKTIHAAQAFARAGVSDGISGDYGSFTPEDVRSHDGRLTACQRVEGGFADRMTRQVIVEIRDNETGEIVGSFSPARAWDFWGICWERDNYNIWVQSGDTGCHCYRYEDGVWERDWFDTERPDYIISRYDRIKENAKGEEGG